MRFLWDRITRNEARIAKLESATGNGPGQITPADVIGLQELLDAKQAVGSYSLANHDHSGLYQSAGSYAAAAHAHAIGDVTGLTVALDAKQPSGSYASAVHTHTIADVTGLQSALDGKQVAGNYAAATHGHVIADVAGLQAALDGKQAAGSYALTSHTHAGVYEPVIAAGTAAQYYRGDKTWQTLPSGSDPWTYLKVTGSDFQTTLATWTTITGLTFTPPANSVVEIEAVLLISTATATVGPRPGLNWGTGLLGGAATIKTPSSLTAELITHQTIGAIAGNAQAPVGGLPVINVPYRAHILATIRTGPSPQAINIQLASETAGIAVKAQVGSFLKYRII